MMIKRYSIKADTLFALSSFFVLMLVSSLARLLLFLWNRDLAAASATSDIIMGFVVGLRFDLLICSIGLLPMALTMLLPFGLVHRRVWIVWLMVVAGAQVLAALVEPIFYDEFHSRLSSVAIQYLKEDTATVLSMLINGTPFFTLNAVFLGCLAGLFFVFRALDRHFHELAVPVHLSFKNWLPRVPVTLFILALLIVGARGGTVRKGAPLRWGDAVHSQDTFANHLALNGVFTFAKAVEGMGNKKEANTIWLKSMAADQALALTREMVLLDNDTLLNPEQLALYRNTVPRERVLPGNVKNVVFILLESFSARYTAGEGSTAGVTPYFDALVKDGVLFNHAFSNGTHTHQGMFATFACFPNTPGNEYLMQSEEGNTKFSGYAPILNQKGFDQNVYVYNGAFNWDNQNGFFGNQGITNFIGRYEMENPVFEDPTWGVSDEDVFNRSLIELDKMSATGKPFYAMIQTLSNHLPYALPEKLEIEPVTGQEPRNERLTVMKYSDWALGKFFEAAKQQPWYNDTLFVLTGDHGFSVEQLVTPIDLLRHHVPVLMIAPGLREAVGEVIPTVMSQVDIVPTAMGLFGESYAQHCWGRDILALDKGDSGFAIFKPSGSHPLVALVEGDKLIVKQPDLEPELFSYTLGANPSATMLDDAELEASLFQKLAAYLQTALLSLGNKSVGDHPGLKPLQEL